MNIFISNLTYHTTDNDLQQLFTTYGTVESAKVIIDKTTGRSKGFGFVEMPDDNQGTESIAKLNGSVVEGRTLVVTVARPRETKSYATPY